MNPTTVIESCLYQVAVMHNRLSPKAHKLEHKLFQFYIDLDELAQLQARFWWFGFNRNSIYSFYEQDHFPLNEQPAFASLPLKQRVLTYLAQEGYALPSDAKIRLLTHLRCFGHVFNPVSFYFVANAQDEPLLALAEVGNTFGEQKLFIVPKTEGEASEQFRLKVAKLFYVSPFSPLKDDFEFRLRTPNERLALAVHSFDAETQKVTIATTQTGKKKNLTHWNIFCFTVLYPLVTLRVLFLIHMHAFVLWMKRVPFLFKEAHPELQQKKLCPFTQARKTLQALHF